MNNFTKNYNRTKSFLSSSSALLMLLLLVVIFLFNFNLDIFKVGADVAPITGQGTPGFIAKWILGTATKPVVTTNPVTAGISPQTTATGGGTITSNGGATIMVSGCVWNKTGTPVYNSSQGPIPGETGQTTNGFADNSPWPCAITGLVANTTYHVLAYAVNGVGTSYGADVQFTTTASIPDGVLGCANGKVFDNGTTSYGSCPQCSVGNSSNPTFPPPTGAAGVVSWRCQLSGGNPSGFGSATQNAPPIINGACGATHYLCSSGSLDLSSKQSKSSSWNWICQGINGTNSSCTELKKKPIIKEN